MSLSQHVTVPVHVGEENPAAENPTAGISMWRAFQTTKLYDLLAAIPLIAWFIYCMRLQLAGVVAQIQRATPNTIDFQFAVFLLAQIAAFFFVFVVFVLVVLRRPAGAKARGLMPRFFAFAGAYLGFGIVALPQHELGTTLSLVSLLLILGGVGYSIFAILHLGRSFSVMAEARRLVIDGPYAAVRHPLYLGEAISTLGLVLQYISPAAILVAAVQFAFQLKRMQNEERVLSNMFPEYAAYASRTARLMPGIY
ncbi:MAG TPA: isoprenylcysteine carboxylmethyltransferase family protein [Micropepsaceae bacterium]|nr:isoprenylcysteine carboxylmethyltransferase family protein [Micropepsaceae bacterium]